mgnify:CR=1 FL=1
MEETMFGPDDEEDGLLTFDDGFGRHGLAQERLMLFKRGDELLPVLNLKR